MDISIRPIGKTIIEMKIDNWGSTITSDITDLDGTVNEGFIQNLVEIAEQLTDHNNKHKQINYATKY
jgi:hypothetical protein